MFNLRALVSRSMRHRCPFPLLASGSSYSFDVNSIHHHGVPDGRLVRNPNLQATRGGYWLTALWDGERQAIFMFSGH